MSYCTETAYSRFKELKQTYGGFLSHRDVEYVIQINEDLPKLGMEGVPLAEVLERRQWEVLRRFDLFKSAMLDDHSMLLVNVRGQGYRIANPKEHAEIAASDFAEDFRKSTRKASRTLHGTNKDLLTAAETARLTEVEVRIAGLTVHVKSNLPTGVKYRRKRIG